MRFRVILEKEVLDPIEPIPMRLSPARPSRVALGPTPRFVQLLELEGGSSLAGWALSGQGQPDSRRLTVGWHLPRFILLRSLKLIVY
jgi:hypothetical protein